MNLKGGKYLTFLLGEEEYGIPIHKVKEIIGIMDITQIPRAPEFIKGVINLRGKIILVMDLRIKFELEKKDYNQRTCIIVVEVDTDECKKQIGIIVDAVSEVLNIQPDDIELPPQYGTQGSEGFLQGMGKAKGKVILILDLDRVFGSDDFSLQNDI